MVFPRNWYLILACKVVNVSENWNCALITLVAKGNHLGQVVEVKEVEGDHEIKKIGLETQTYLIRVFIIIVVVVMVDV